MRFHQVALPHTLLTDDYMACAYTQKCRKFAKMMTQRGHEVITYGSGDEADIEGTFVSIMSEEERVAIYGDYDHRKEFFKLEWNPEHPHFSFANMRTIHRLREFCENEPDEFLCIIGGTCQKPIADAMPGVMPIEHGVGYSGIFSPYVVFESYAWMHYVYGMKQMDGSPWHAVIPNFFDPEDFAFNPEPKDYHLFVGRLVARKGLEDAVEATRAMGKTLIVAGQGGEWDGRTLSYPEGSVSGEHIIYIGHVDRDERNEWMRNAEALWCPTRYVEPFGGVSVEAMFTGTPVIATDWGAMSETVIHGLSGYRFRTRAEAIWAASQVKELPRAPIAQYANMNFSLQAIGGKYEAYFDSLLGRSINPWTRFRAPLVAH